jgi:hypothetical protein
MTEQKALQCLHTLLSKTSLIAQVEATNNRLFVNMAPIFAHFGSDWNRFHRLSQNESMKIKILGDIDGATISKRGRWIHVKEAIHVLMWVEPSFRVQIVEMACNGM